jgi:rod shape-determining protein MreD
MYKNFAVKENFIIILPRLISVLLITLCGVKYNITGFSYLIPSIESLILFYWTIHNPRVVSKSFLIILGIYQDLLTGLPLGLSSLCYIIMNYALLSQRRYFIKSPFNVTWIGFFIFNLFAIILKSMLLMLYYQDFFVPTSMVIYFITTICCYPIFHLLFNHCNLQDKIVKEHA